MQREKKLKILWAVLFAVFLIAAALLLAFGIRAGIYRSRTSDFAVDTSFAQVSSVYESDGSYAVGCYDGTVRLYSGDLSVPAAEYKIDGASVRTVAIRDGKLYAAASDRYIYVLGEGGLEQKRRVGLVPERLYFSADGEYIAAYGVSDSSNRRGLYFLKSGQTGDYSSCVELQSGIDGAVLNNGYAYYCSGQIIMRSQIDAKRVLDSEEVYTADRAILGLTAHSGGFAAIDTEGAVYSFDSQFNYTGRRSNDTGTLSAAFDADGCFVCKIKNGGVTGVGLHGINFNIPSGISTLIVYASPQSFAYLTEDGGELKYYTLDMARRVQLQKTLFVPLIVLGAVMLLAAAYSLVSVFCSSRRRVNGAFKKFGKTLYKHKFAYISLLPTFLLLAIFYWYPIVNSLFMSVFDYLPGERLNFVGFENFKMVFMNAQFWVSFKNTLIFLVTDLIKALLPPILFAEFLLALRSKRTSYIIRVLLFLPGILPGVASMLVWADGIFGSSSSGLLNGFMAAVLPSWVNKAWLMNDKTALASLIFMNFPWVGSYLIFFGAISGVDKEIYEAAKLDGCGWLRRVIKIDIPLILPQIKYVFIQTFISSVQNYTLILITTGGDFGTNTPALMMYFTTVVQKNYGVASAMGVVLLLFLMVATVINFKMQIGGGNKRKNVKA